MVHRCTNTPNIHTHKKAIDLKKQHLQKWRTDGGFSGWSIVDIEMLGKRHAQLVMIWKGPES